ncbi:MAG: sugar phosphate isomerase/epimerase family protein [Armatimonadota bacterium]
MSTIALQLYTVRDAMADDFTGTLRRIRDIGFTSVETAFFPEGITFDAAKAELDRHGLKVRSAHVPLPDRDNIGSLQDLAGTLGTTDIVWHGWPRDARHDSRDGMDSLIRSYAEANRIAREHGLRLHLHNHWWEFDTCGGPSLFERLLVECEDLPGIELDTYWAMVAGQDPLALIANVRDHISLIHLKDGPGIPDAPKVALGDGVLPLSEICAETRGDTTWIVELDDCEDDIFDALAKSLRRLESEPAND